MLHVWRDIPRIMTMHKSPRFTRILATLGPASSSKDMILALAKAGANVFRLNFSHGNHADHTARFEAIRAVEQELGRPIAVVADLQGPKLRLGTFAEGAITVSVGHKIRLDMDPNPGTAQRICMPHPEIFAGLKAGNTLLVDDGKVRLLLESCGPDFANCVVEAGTRLSDRKGVNVPDAIIPLDALTPKDRKDLDHALSLGVDYIALSFVQKPEDVAEARKLIDGRAGIISKIEKPSAVTYLSDIIALSDAVMVARGDLGVELPPEDVPAIQKQIVRQSRAAGKPVIVATQMLESMISSPTPTRAEASDVAGAVYDGADSVMLSAETASGSYPLEAVTIMDRICRKAEQDPLYRTMLAAQTLPHDNTAADAITSAAKAVAESVQAACITTFTSSGSTALKAARERPNVPILCLSPSDATLRRVTLAYGIYPVNFPIVHSFEETVTGATSIAKTHKLAASGQSIVITAGVPFGATGTTNALRVARVED